MAQGCIYLIIFHRGRWVEKLTAVLIFYPAVIAVNYMMQDIGSNIFFGLSGDNIGDNISEWPPGALLLSTGIHTATLLARLLFWTGAWLFLRKYLKNTTYTLTNRMWLIVDTLMLASVVSIFTIIYFMPERMIIVYPICAASIFSSFGCIYLASYMCSAMQTAWHAQELVGMWNSYFDAMIYLNDANLQPLQLVLRSILVQNTPQPGMIADIQSTAEMAKVAEQLKYATIRKSVKN